MFPSSSNQNIGAMAKLSMSGLPSVGYSNIHEMTNSIIEIPEVRVQQQEWRVTLHLYVREYVQVWGDGCTRYFLTHHWVNVVLGGVR